ncbi:17112_t:CDS:2, partial [Entrophospora sp. SA101]
KKEKRQLFSKKFNRFHTDSIQFSENINEEASVKSKTSSIVHSILHGSAATKEEEKHTHSKSLHCPKIANDPDNSVHLCGSWQTEIGDLDTFVHIWEYYGYKGYHDTYNRLNNDSQYQQFLKEIRPILLNRYSQICLEHRGLECRRQFCEPVGAWFSQLGLLNRVHHMWQYPDLENRKITREKAWEVDGWAETVYKTVRLVQKMETNILKPLDFSPLR